MISRMRLTNLYFFLTFVVLGSLTWINVQAAPSTQIEPGPIVIRPLEAPPKASRRSDLKDSLQTAMPPALSTTGPLTLADLPSVISRFNLGYVQGTLRPEKKETLAPSYGLSRVAYLPDFTSREWEGAVTGDNLLLAQWSYRSYCCYGNYHGAYYKGGFGAAYDPSDGLANVINYQRYYAHGGIGLDNLGRSHNRFGLELEIIFGFSGLAFSTTFGVAY